MSEQHEGAAVTVLFSRSNSIYKTFPRVDVWDKERNALNWPGGTPVVAHPPCRGWGRLRKLANPEPGEKELAFFAVDQVRKYGGVLEHPASSTLWGAAGLPYPGRRDGFGGWTLPVKQQCWGHRAEKPTWLYIVGCGVDGLPTLPFVLGRATHIIGSSGRRSDGSRLHKGDQGWRPEVAKQEREATPVEFAIWLVALATRCEGKMMLNKWPGWAC